MENATKALIIAGAIFIAILLITVGIAMFNSTRGLQDSVGDSSKSMAVSTFNSQFTGYLGTDLSNVQIKMLLSRIIANNADTTESRIVEVSGLGGTTPEDIMLLLVVGKRYSARPTFDGEEGRLSSVLIEEMPST